MTSDYRHKGPCPGAKLRRLFSTLKPSDVENQHIRSTSAFYRDNKIFWIFLKALGLLPYQLSTNGEMIFKKCSLEMMYCLVIFCCWSYPVLFVLRHRCTQLIETPGSFDRDILIYLLAISMLPHVFIPSTHWLEMGTFVKIFRIWQRFQEIYEEVMKENLVLRIRWKRQIFMLSLMILSWSLVIIKNLTYWVDHSLEIVAHCYVLFVVLLHKVFFVTSCSKLTNIARAIRHRLEEALLQEDVQTIQKMAAVWCGLNQVTNVLGCLFYKMQAFIILMTFTVATITWYYICSVVGFRLNIYMLSKLALLVNNSLWIHLICESGEVVAREVGEKFATCLTKHRTLCRSSEVKTEVDGFIQIVTAVPPRVTLKGFTTINRTLLVSMKATMVTYLIVVLQFSSEYTSPFVRLHPNSTNA